MCAVSLWLTCKLWESNESIARKCRHSSSRDVTTEEPRRWSRTVRVTMADIHGQHWQMICGNYQRILCIVCFHITSVESNTQRGWRGEAAFANFLWNNWIDSVLIHSRTPQHIRIIKFQDSKGKIWEEKDTLVSSCATSPPWFTLSQCISSCWVLWENSCK